MELPIEVTDDLDKELPHPSQSSNPEMVWPSHVKSTISDESFARYGSHTYQEHLAWRRKVKAEHKRQKLIKKQRKRNRKRG